MRAVRYTNSKGNSIILGNSPIPTTLQDGIVGCWPMDNVSEYPDNPAGVIYFQDAWATTDGWSVTNGTFSVSGGIATFERTGGTTAFITRSIAYTYAGQFRLRIKRVSGTGNIRIKSDSSGSEIKIISITDLPADNTYRVFDFTYPETTTKFGQILLDGITMVDIDWMYVGNGTYSTKLPDISTFANNLTINGATPTTGIVSNGLSFNGLSNNLVTDSNYTIPDIFSFVTWYNSTSASATYTRPIFEYGTYGSAAFVEVARDINSTGLIVSAWNGSTVVSSTFASFFTNAESALLSCVVNWSTKSVTVYKNNALFGSGTLTAAIKPSGDVLYIGGRKGATTTNAWYGLLDEIKIYNRAITAAEINAIYRQNAAPFVATGETSYGVIEAISGIDQAETNVASTRAPVQDGATYIDTLLNIREVTVNGSLTVPKNIDTIYSQRKIVQDVLNPKYGLGTLDFFYGRNTINHRTLKNVAVDKLSFPNKPYQSPYQEFSVSFDGNDPYWYDPLTGTGSICILSGTSRTFTVGGENDTPPLITVYGAATNPSITNSTTSETIAMTYSLAGGSYINIDTNFGAKTIKLNGSTNLIGYLNIGSTFPRLQVGSNTVSYTGGGYIIILWRNRYVGV